MDELRLNKVLAQAGITSRRGADRLIEEGAVTVNGRIVRELGTRVDPATDVVKVHGKRIPPPPVSHLYLMLNKPDGYVTTLSDPEGRPTVKDLLPPAHRRVFPVGRLDFHSEGLLILTDDGALSRDLMHPSRGVPKTYLVKVRGMPSREALQRIRSGVVLDGKRTSPARVKTETKAANAWLRVTIHEGRKHQVRLMLQAVGHRVLRLKRIRYAGLELGPLPAGKFRSLTESEIRRLRKATAGGPKRRRPVKKTSRA